MKFSVKISGSTPHYDAPVVRREVTSALADIAEIGAENARQRVLQPPKTGRIYGGKVSFATRAGKAVSFAAKAHQASAPGESPANWIGALVAATKSIVGAPESLYAAFLAAKDYAVYLEKGTRKMAPRPFMRPAALAAVQKKHLLIAAAVRRGMRASKKAAK
ncbi:MAG: hypothetical protein ACR65U_14425 [Methylocystis sp.]